LKTYPHINKRKKKSSKKRKKNYYNNCQLFSGRDNFLKSYTEFHRPASRQGWEVMEIHREISNIFGWNNEEYIIIPLLQYSITPILQEILHK
jgi:hypothetical protein